MEKMFITDLPRKKGEWVLLRGYFEQRVDEKYSSIYLSGFSQLVPVGMSEVELGEIGLRDEIGLYHVFFGEVALVDKDTRSASVYALTPCNTLKLDGGRFKLLCDQEPVLGYYVMKKIAQRIAAALRRSNKDLMILYAALIDEVHGE